MAGEGSDGERIQLQAADKAARRRAKRARDKAIRKASKEPDDHVFLFQEECEIHLNPSLSSCWGAIGEPILIPSAGQNKKVPISSRRSSSLKMRFAPRFVP